MSVKKAIKNVLAHHYVSKEQKHEEALCQPANWQEKTSLLTNEEKQSAIQMWGGVLN